MLAAATFLGLALRMSDLSRLGLGTDEGHSAWLAAQPLSELPGLLRRDSAPPLYYALLHIWQAGFGSDAGIRGLSVLLGTASIPVTFLITRTLLGTWCGVASSFFMAASPFHGIFSQTAKNNALLLLISQLTLLALLRACERPSRRLAWSGYALGVAALLYTHAVAPFVIATLGVVFLILCRKDLKAALRPWILSHVAAALLFLPWAGIAFHQAGEVSRAFWADPPSPSAPLRTFFRLILFRPPAPAEALVGLGGGFKSFAQAPILGAAMGAVPRSAWWIPVLLATLAGTALLARAGRGRELLVLAALYAVPVAGIWLISHVVASIYLDRILLPAMMPLPILLAAPAALMGRSRGVRDRAAPGWLLGAGVASSALVLPMMIFSSYYFTEKRQGAEWREAARYVAEEGRDGDAIVYVAHFGQILFERYMGEGASKFAPYGLPSGWYAGDAPTVGKWVRGGEDLGPLDEAGRNHLVVWLIQAHTEIHDPGQLALEWCRTHLRETGTRRFMAIQVTRFEAAGKDAPAASAIGG